VNHGIIIEGHRGTTWEDILNRSWSIITAFCALIGAICIIIWIIKRIRRRLEQQFIQFHRAKNEAIIKSITHYCESHNSEPEYTRFIACMTPLKESLAEFCDATVDSKAKINKQAMALSQILNQDIISAAKELVSKFPDKELGTAVPDTVTKSQELSDIEETSRLMVKFRADINSLTHEIDNSDIHKVLCTSMKIYDRYILFANQLVSHLKTIRNKYASPDYHYQIKDLYHLWDIFNILDVTKAIDTQQYPVYGNTNFEYNGLTLKNCYCGRMIFVTLLFFNQTRPKVFTEPEDNTVLHYATRPVYNFNPKRDQRGYNNHGNAYKILVQAMSPDHAMLSPEERPLLQHRLMDIIWDRCLSERHDTIGSLRPDKEQEKSLSSAVMAATALSHKPTRIQ